MSTVDDLHLIERQLRPWLAEEGIVREPKDLFERVASGTRSVRQRPGWVVRLLGNGNVGVGAGPAARWREHRMATALGLGTIVIVTALGIGSLGPGPLTGGTPAAVSDAPSPSASPTEPVAVTGTMTSWDVQSYGSTVTEDGIYWSEGPWWTITWEASDPRLSGQGTRSANWNESVATGTGIGTSTYVLVNPDGRWLGSGSFAQAEGEMSEMVVLHGEGAYDGLTASVFHQTDFSSPHTFAGVIFPGEPPTIPEPVEPPAE